MIPQDGTFMRYSFVRATASAALFLLAGNAARAADDHGHEHGNAPATAGAAALPRFAAVSETFELVGVLSGKQLTIYLDRFADNSPVKDARLELEIDGTKMKAEPHGEGEFEVMLAEAPKPGVLSVAATVVSGKDSDLLAGELDILDAAHVDAAAQGPKWQRVVSSAFAGLLALGLLAWGSRRVMAARRKRFGGAV